MRKKRNTIWIAAMLTAAVLTGFSGCTEGEIPSLSSSDTAETTTASPEESAAESNTEETAETSAEETEAAAETAETIPAPEKSQSPQRKPLRRKRQQFPKPVQTLRNMRLWQRHCSGH